MKIKGYKAGYICPCCSYVQPDESIDFDNPGGETKIKCPVCGGNEKYKKWDICRYPMIESEE